MSDHIGPKSLCTFCGRRNYDAGSRVFIAGPNSQIICEPCVFLCVEIIRDHHGASMTRRLDAWLKDARSAKPAEREVTS